MHQMFWTVDGSPAGEPGPLPAELVGLSPDSLADLAAALDPCPEAFAGLGFAAVAPAPDYAALRAGRAAAIDAAATAEIKARLPLERQLALTRRAVELVDIRIDRALTPAEAAERTELQAWSAWAAAVRAHAGALTAALAGLADDAAAIGGFEIAGWPSWAEYAPL